MRIELGPIVTDARGRFSGMVFSNWKGQSLVRRFVPPSQPRTPRQVSHRNAFRFLQDLYEQKFPQNVKNSWIMASAGRQYTARNRFTSINLPSISTDTDLDALRAFIPTPGTPLVSYTAAVAAPTAATATVRLTTQPTPPEGYQIDDLYAVAVQDINPQVKQEVADVYTQFQFGSATTTLTFQGLTTKQKYTISMVILLNNNATGKDSYSTVDVAQVTTP